MSQIDPKTSKNLGNLLTNPGLSEVKADIARFRGYRRDHRQHLGYQFQGRQDIVQNSLFDQISDGCEQSLKCP